MEGPEGSSFFSHQSAPPGNERSNWRRTAGLSHEPWAMRSHWHIYIFIIFNYIVLLFILSHGNNRPVPLCERVVADVAREEPLPSSHGFDTVRPSGAYACGREDSAHCEDNQTECQWTDNLKRLPPEDKDRPLCMDNRENTCWMSASSSPSCILYLSVCAVHPENHDLYIYIYHLYTPVPPLLYPSAHFSAACPLEPREDRVAQNATNGENKTHTTTLTYTSACIQTHNHTQRLLNTLLYICTVYPLCAVWTPMLYFACWLVDGTWPLFIEEAVQVVSGRTHSLNSLCQLYIYPTLIWANSQLIRQKKVFSVPLFRCEGSARLKGFNPLKGRITSPLMSDGTWPQRAWVGEERREGKLGRSN